VAVFGWILGTVILETTIVTIAVIASSKLHPENPREIIPMAARFGLPQVPGAILLGGIFAKVISTANNYLFSPSSNLIHDVYKRFVNPAAGEKKTLLVSRTLVVLLGLFALLQAAYFESILKAALYAYTVYGAAVTPAVMAVFFWKRATASGAVASIVLGTLVTIAWNITGEHAVDAVYPALAISLIALIGISLMGRPPEVSKWKPFFES
jgi:solute:Na+ symporter, SSS family